MPGRRNGRAGSKTTERKDHMKGKATARTKITAEGNTTAELSDENYLLIFGSNTGQGKKRAIQWKGYILDRLGQMQYQLEKNAPQAGHRGLTENP